MRIVHWCSLSVLIALCVPAFAEQRVGVTSSEVIQPEQIGKPSTSPAEGIGRGFLNMCTCWLELPRNIVYDNVRLYPVLGVFTGTAKGLFYTVGRGLVGTVDVVSFGFTRNLLYDEKSFPEYIWDAPWY